MGESSFSILREIGILPLEGHGEIHFSIDVYRMFRYVSIRRYIEIDGLPSPTRDGLTLTPEIVQLLVPKICALSDDQAQIADVQLGKFAKRPGMCVVVGIGSFKGIRGLALRQWEEEKGWTKKVIWLPLEKIKEIKKLFQDTLAALNEQPLDDF